MARVAHKDSLTTDQEKFVRMEANGTPTPDIIKKLWNKVPDDPEYHACECKLSRWRKHPKYEEVWKDEVRRQCFPMMSEGLKVIRQQMKDGSQPWLLNKAANDAISFAGKKIYGNDENTVTVQISGMPDIGSPDDDV